jgi:hypothetical protein
MRSSSKYKCCGISCIIIGAILLILGILFQIILNALIAYGAEKGAALTADTEDNWNGIPGAHDILVTRNFYLYNCTNHEDVLFLGARPEFEEYGPYYY